MDGVQDFIYMIMELMENIKICLYNVPNKDKI